MNIPQPAHPVWSILRLAVVMAALTAILFVTANKFDDTEIRTIIYVFLFAAGVEGVPQVAGKVARALSRKDDEAGE